MITCEFIKIRQLCYVVVLNTDFIFLNEQCLFVVSPLLVSLSCLLCLQLLHQDTRDKYNMRKKEL